MAKKDILKRTVWMCKTKVLGNMAVNPGVGGCMALTVGK